MKFIEILEKNLQVKSKKEFMPMQPGDVKSTASCNYNLNDWVGFSPKVSIEEGTKLFSRWYLDFYKSKN